MNKNFMQILKELLRHRFKLCIVFIALIGTSISMLSFGHIFRILIDQGIAKGDMEAIKGAILMLAFVIFILGLGIFFRAYYINLISHLVTSEIRIRVYNSLINRAPDYFDSVKISDYSNRFSSDLNFIGDMIVNLLSFSLRNCIMFIGGIIMMFFVNVKLSLITMAILPLTMVLVKLIGKKIKNNTSKMHKQKSQIAEIISESLNNIKLLYAMNAKDFAQNKLLIKDSDYHRFTENALKSRSMFFACAIASISLVILLVIWIGGADVVANKISAGNMVSFIFYALMSAFSIGGIADVFGDIQKFLTGAERVFEMEKLSPNNFATKKFNIRAPYNLSVNIRKFSYPTRPDIQILENIKFEAQAGEFVGIVGPSGAGKSSIFQLIMSIYKSEQSKVQINDKDVDLGADPNLREQIAYITQEPFLFSGDIEENIKLGRDNGPLDEVIEVTGLKNVIAKLPSGMKSYIGEKGTQLSGGQKQRIAIARALYGNPGILLMDEATSALDNKSESILLKSLRKSMKGKLIISIAHRLSSLNNADRIIFIHDGKIIDQGPHEELLKGCELYKNLADNELI